MNQTSASLTTQTPPAWYHCGMFRTESMIQMSGHDSRYSFKLQTYSRMITFSTWVYWQVFSLAIPAPIIMLLDSAFKLLKYPSLVWKLGCRWMSQSDTSVILCTQYGRFDAYSASHCHHQRAQKHRICHGRNRESTYISLKWRRPFYFCADRSPSTLEGARPWYWVNRI